MTERDSGAATGGARKGEGEKPAWLDAEGAALYGRVEALVARGPDAAVDEAARDALALELFDWQRGRCAAIDRVARAFVGTGALGDAARIPGVPTDAFKTARIACFDPAHTTRVFRTSGTTQDVRGEHAFADTGLYAKVSVMLGERYLLRDPRGYRFALMAENEREAPHSSLTFMLARFAERFARGDAAENEPWLLANGRLVEERARETFARALREATPVALLGATFAFVHFADALAPGERIELPPGSVAMPTGGFKGRARELEPAALFELLRERFGLAREAIVQEYGMTELSSQAFEAHPEGASPPGVYVTPPWMNVVAVDPETLAPLPHGAVGMLRIIDLANVGSCIAIQTADIGRTSARGFEVHGRATGATPRGCARAMDALLSSSR